MAGYNDSVKSANVITGILSNATLQGDSAYEVAVKNGFVGTEAEWLASLKGDQGDQGIQGPIGPTGPTGATGNGISTIDMGSSGWMSIHTTDGTDYSFYVKGDKGNKGDTGVGISTVLLNSDYTLTITLTDGDTYTTDPIRGAKGETGTSITNVTLNSNYTLTITMSDGTSYTTGSIRGAKGDKGDTGSKGDKGTSISSVTKTGTSGLVDTYTITYDDGTTSTFTVTNGQNATVEVTSDTDGDYRLTFTDVNGSIETPNLYSDVTASAKQLLSESYTLDQVPYLFRKSPDSDRAVEEIVGGTVGWNQLADNGRPPSSRDGYTITANGDGTFTVNGIGGSTNTAASGWFGLENDAVKRIAGHKVLASFKLRSGSFTDSSKVSFGVINTATTRVFLGMESILSIPPTIDASSQSHFQIGANNSASNAKMTIICSDLTTMFGSTIADYIYSLETATAGAGVAKLKEWGFFTEDYYPYSEPTLRSIEGLQSKKTVGFNQWDGKLNSAVNGWKISTNYMPVVPGETYYTHLPTWTSGAMYAETYDAEKNLINGSFSLGRNDTFTIPSDVRFLKPKIWHTADETNLCINLSDPTRNGQYEPYESHTYSLDSSVVLRGVFKLDENNNLRADGDIYPADGQGKRRYGLVDLGTLNWIRNTQYVNPVFLADIPLAKMPSSSSFLANAVCAIYEQKEASSTNVEGVNKVFAIYKYYNSAYGLNIIDSSYTDAATFKTAMSGVYLLYELATPTTFTAQPYHNPQIVGDTEEWVTTGIVPVGHSTKYYQNLRKKIENLPWNFSDLIAPTEVTNKATRNYTAGSYLILNNVLYKVTSNIANGSTITPNTNVTATTIMAEIMAL